MERREWRETHEEKKDMPPSTALASAACGRRAPGGGAHAQSEGACAPGDRCRRARGSSGREIPMELGWHLSVSNAGSALTQATARGGWSGGCRRCGGAAPRATRQTRCPFPCLQNVGRGRRSRRQWGAGEGDEGGGEKEREIDSGRLLCPFSLHTRTHACTHTHTCVVSVFALRLLSGPGAAAGWDALTRRKGHLAFSLAPWSEMDPGGCSRVQRAEKAQREDERVVEWCLDFCVLESVGKASAVPARPAEDEKQPQP